MEKKDYISLLHKNNIYPSGSQTARSFSRSGKHQKRENHGKKANSKFSLARRGFHLCPISQIKDPILPKKIVTSRMRSRRNEYWTSPLRTKSDREATQSLIDRKVSMFQHSSSSSSFPCPVCICAHPFQFQWAPSLNIPVDVCVWVCGCRCTYPFQFQRAPSINIPVGHVAYTRVNMIHTCN